MVIRGNTRGNAKQLSHYLLAQKDNEAIRILDVKGQADAGDEDLHHTIFLMGVSAELSNGDKGLYHAQINPDPKKGELNDAQWLEAADILGKQLKLDDQTRAIVLHTKKGRTHAHIVWERFDHDRGILVSDSFSRLAQDRARHEMEAAFGHAQTPHRNKHRPELKAALTELWNSTDDGQKFVKSAHQNRYLIAAGSGRSPFVVVDENGRSYDLTRQLKGVRLKEVRQRLRQEHLPGEKEAIIQARNTAVNDSQGGGDKGKQKASFTNKTRNTMSEEFTENKGDITGQDSRAAKPTPSDQFRENKSDMGADPKSESTVERQFRQNQQDMGVRDEPQKQQQDQKQQFKDNKAEVTGQEREKSTKEQFAENKSDLTTDKKKQEEEKRREEFKKQMQDMKNQQTKTKNNGFDMG